MSDKDITVMLEKRETVGKGLNKLKQDGKIPAVIHDHGKDSIIVAGDFMQLSKVFAEAGKSHPVTLKVGDTDYFAIIKDTDFDPKKNNLRHIVFSTIDRNQKVKAEVPIVITGEIPAERVGLIILKAVDHLEIEALPKNLIDELEVDGSSLNEVGDKLHISDIKVPEGVEIVTKEDSDEDQTIVTVDMPRAQVSEEDEAAEGEEGEEGEDTGEGESEGEASDQKSEDTAESGDKKQD